MGREDAHFQALQRAEALTRECPDLTVAMPGDAVNLLIQPPEIVGAILQ